MNQLQIPQGIKFQRRTHSDGKIWFYTIEGILINGYKQVISQHHRNIYTVGPSQYLYLMDKDIDIDSLCIPCKLEECLIDDIKIGDWFTIDDRQGYYLKYNEKMTLFTRPHTNSGLINIEFDLFRKDETIKKIYKVVTNEL